jgi:2-polyprenyl-3-methyl-5-hydroxy-6-metoxy-1,4-benzoquinol methylase
MKIFNFIKKYINTNGVSQTESAYYEQMFVKNPFWNKPNPNVEEQLRWTILESFVNYVKDNYYPSTRDKFTILDLGCGRGWLTFLLSKYGNIVGIEPVKPVVKYAKKMFPHLTFICGTTKDLIRQNKEFKTYDLIVSSEVIEHIPDDKKGNFIEDISKLLNDKGFLILTTPRKEAQEEWNSYMQPDQPIEDWISEQELESLVVQKGFVKHKMERFSIPPIEGAPEIEIYQLWLFQKI